MTSTRPAPVSSRAAATKLWSPDAITVVTGPENVFLSPKSKKTGSATRTVSPYWSHRSAVVKSIPALWHADVGSTGRPRMLRLGHSTQRAYAASVSSRPIGVLSRPLLPASIAIFTTTALVAFEALAVTAAIPELAADLGQVALLPWVITGYILTSSVSTVIAGPLVDGIGTRIIFRWAVGIFVAASIGAALASTMPLLIVGPGRAGRRGRADLGRRPGRRRSRLSRPVGEPRLRSQRHGLGSHGSSRAGQSPLSC